MSERVHSVQRRQVSIYFLHLIRGMTKFQIGELLDLGQSSPAIYVYSFAKRSATLPAKGQVNWILEYLLTLHSRKHVFSLKMASLTNIFFGICC